MEHIQKLNDLMAQKFPAQTYIIERIIPDASITILSGHSRSFKTYALLEMALSVASGKPLFEQFNTQQTGVLIIDEENGQRLLQKRLRQLGTSDDHPVYFTTQMGFDLSDTTINNTVLFCTEKGIKLVIIDSLIRIHNSDENSSKDMSKVFKQLRRFTEADIAILITQHHRKPGAVNTGAGTEMRGSGDILAAVDSHIAVTRKDKWYLNFNQTKQRYDAELEPFEVKVAADEQSFNFEFIGMKQTTTNKSEQTLDFVTQLLNEHAKLKQKDLLRMLLSMHVKTNEHSLRQLLNRWVAEGTLPQPIAGSGNTKYYHLGQGSNNE